MSNRVHVLDTPGSYDCIHMCQLEEQGDGTAEAVVRYTLNGGVPADTNEPVTITSGDVTSWKGDWDPSTHTTVEHFLEKWVAAEAKPAGSLGAVIK